MNNFKDKQKILKKYIQEYNNKSYKSDIIFLDINYKNCWFCEKKIKTKKKYCSLFCELIFENFLKKHYYNIKYMFFPFELFDDDSKTKILDLIKKTKNITYDDIIINTDIMSNKNSLKKIKTKILFIHKLNIVYSKKLNLKIKIIKMDKDYINIKKTYKCLNCSKNTSKCVLLNNNNIILGICSLFCYKVFNSFYNVFLSFNKNECYNIPINKILSLNKKALEFIEYEKNNDENSIINFKLLFNYYMKNFFFEIIKIIY